MSASLDTAREVYTTGSRNQNQAIELLERQIGRLENYPEMVDRLCQHLQESDDAAGEHIALLWRSGNA